MRLSEFKKYLSESDNFEIQLPDGKQIPSHFHITEMGIVNKKYTDCGNTFREENYFTFQLWHTDDVWHRLTSEKVIKIISGIEKNTVESDYEIIVEYQTEATIGKFGLAHNGTTFVLTSTKTTCLANSQCGIIPEKAKKELQELTNCCQPNSNCC